jgi:hypothetical protein
MGGALMRRFWLTATALAALTLLTGAYSPDGVNAVDTTAKLNNVPSTAAPYVMRMGFAAPGDAPPLMFMSSNAACSLNSGNGDGGTQVKSLDNKCWLARHDLGTQDIRQWGCLPGTTADIVPCMTAAQATLGNAPIRIPQGIYEIKSAATFTTTPNFYGDGWPEYQSVAACPTGNVRGTWLHMASTATAIVPFTVSGGTAAGSGGFKHMAFCQDHATPGGGWAPTAYQPLFQLTDVAGEIDFDDLYFYAIKDAINVTGTGANTNGRITFGKIRGQVFNSFLVADRVLDEIHGIDLHFWVYWSANANVASWQIANSELIVLKRVDGFNISDFFAWGNRSCLNLSSSVSGNPAGVKFGSFDCDNTQYALRVTGPNTNASFANFNANGNALAGSWNILFDSAVTTAHILIGNLSCNAMGVGCALIVTPAGGNVLEVGTTRVFNFNQQSAANIAAFSAAGGNTIAFGAGPLLTGGNNGGTLTPIVVGGTYTVGGNPFGAISLNNGSNFALPTGAGQVIVRETTGSGHGAAYLISGNQAQLLGGGTDWVAPTTTPAAGKASVNYDGTAAYKVYNNVGATRTFAYKILQMDTVN